MNNQKIEKITFIISLLVIGFFSGIFYSVYNLKIINTKKDFNNNEIITIQILECTNDYYFKK